MHKVGAGYNYGFFISCARACTVASEVSTEAQFFADCKLHILTRPMSFGRWQFLEKKISPSWLSWSYLVMTLSVGLKGFQELGLDFL